MKVAPVVADYPSAAAVCTEWPDNRLVFYSSKRYLSPMDEISPSLSQQLLELQNNHRELDEEILRLQTFPYVDRLQIQRLKKQKLLIKDMIDRVKDDLIPDLNA